MNTKVLVILAVVLCNALLPSALRCKSGYETDPTFLSDTEITTTVCDTSSEQMCIGGEATVEIFTLPTTIVFGACVSPDRCDEACADFVREVADDILGGPLGPVVITDCRKACCNSDNCNANPMQAITEPSAIPSILPRTIPTAVSTITCYSGISNEHTGENNFTDGWQCPSTQNRCLRQEVTTISNSSVTMDFVVAMCADEAMCSESCDSLALSTIGEQARTTTSCLKSCCDLDDCNILSVDFLIELSELDSIPEEPSTISTTTSTPTRTTESTTRSTDAPSTTSTATVSLATRITEDLTASTSRPGVQTKAELAAEATRDETTTPVQPQRSQATLVPDISTEVPYTGPRQCLVGYEVRQYQTEVWDVNACPSGSNYACLKQEFSIGLGDLSAVNVTTGICASQSECESTCRELTNSLRFFLRDISDESGLDYLDISLLPISYCKKACCRSADCDQVSARTQASIETTQATETTTRNTTTPTTSTMTTTSTSPSTTATTIQSTRATTTPIQSTRPITTTRRTTASTTRSTTTKSTTTRSTTTSHKTKTFSTITATTKKPSVPETTGETLIADGGAGVMRINKFTITLFTLLSTALRLAL